MGESAFAVAVAERPDPGDVRFELIVDRDVAPFIVQDASGVEAEVVRVWFSPDREQEVRSLDRCVLVGAIDMSHHAATVSADADTARIQTHGNLFSREDVENCRGHVLIFMVYQSMAHLDDRDL